MAVLIAYLRTCKGGGEERIGVEIQRAAVEDWARRRRHQLAAIVSEAPSAGGLEDRHGLAEALAALHQGLAQGLVVYRLDCLDSALVAQEQLLAEVRATGARVHSLQPDEAAELRRIPADPSRQGVREVLRAAAAIQPQMAALRSRRRRHSRPGAGSPPYGYRIADGSLVPEPAEQAALVRIAELRASGATLREIARELDSNGHKPKRGERWHPESVRRIVERLEPR
ncbi:DNA invertase Pin-like site-specific DNA recombinase [Kribbella sp. VKM Ac-2527]|uniref:DNA invertase Pin-like site-specific DNA recombinase n=1 Tax=Kribbella caucasensis TaxID=2512215 RepID=A0A4R6IXJ6_9ACTN|nr:recombinase family protein [Kribbella sp. VKM Ac-2527]TDO27490.1 DNA invertase Pin-like site-specific DNA recombinase [Kribbella sp. VKM Ac-2527]